MNPDADLRQRAKSNIGQRRFERFAPSFARTHADTDTYTDSDAFAHADCDADCDSDRYPDAHAHSHSNADCDPYCHAFAHADCDSDRDSDRYPDAHAHSHSNADCDPYCHAFAHAHPHSHGYTGAHTHSRSNAYADSRVRSDQPESAHDPINQRLGSTHTQYAGGHCVNASQADDADQHSGDYQPTGNRRFRVPDHQETIGYLEVVTSERIRPSRGGDAQLEQR